MLAAVVLLGAIPSAFADDEADGVPPRVSLSAPRFINGDVPLVMKSLGETLGDVRSCIADNGGLRAKSGFIKLQFLVRDRGRAEGVEVLDAAGVDETASRCVRLLLKNKWVGSPSDDPVGVVFRYQLAREPG